MCPIGINSAAPEKLHERGQVVCSAALELLGIPRSALSELGAAQPAPESRLTPAREALMELRMRLNVLAAIVSFAFLTAIVFGMF